MLVCLLFACLIPCNTTAETTASLIMKGDDLFDAGKYQDAIETYEESITQDPKQARAWAGKGYALNVLKDYENALIAFDEAVAISPNFGKAVYERGNALYGLSRYDEAIIAYDNAIKIYPQYAYLAYYGKAKALQALEKNSDALSLYEKAISLKSDYAPAWNFKGETLSALGRYDEAVLAFDKALSLDPALTVAEMNRQNLSSKMKADIQGSSPLSPETPLPAPSQVQTTIMTPEITGTEKRTGLPFLIIVLGAGLGLFLGRRKV